MRADEPVDVPLDVPDIEPDPEEEPDEEDPDEPKGFWVVCAHAPAAASSSTTPANAEIRID